MKSETAFPAQVLMMVGVALQELQQSEAETELDRIRTLIMNAQSTLVELHALAEKVDEGDAVGKLFSPAVSRVVAQTESPGLRRGSLVTSHLRRLTCLE